LGVVTVILVWVAPEFHQTAQPDLVTTLVIRGKRYDISLREGEINQL